MTKTIPLALLVSALAGASVAACGGDKPVVKNAEPTTTPSAAPAANRLPAKAPDSPTASAVRISDEIVKACGISQPDAYFAFDSSNIRDEDSKVLGQVVTCFTSGPLKGKVMRLVGHADPRGGSDYNLTLGQSRADAVKGYMTTHGMDKSKAESTSRGAMDAQGTDEPTWAQDRRVDMLLAQ